MVPKVLNRTTVMELWPGAFCNTLHNHIAKIICNRHRTVFPSVPDKSQEAFVQRRSILYNKMICEDVVNFYGRKKVSPRCIIIKVDLKQAYDCWMGVR